MTRTFGLHSTNVPNTMAVRHQRSFAKRYGDSSTSFDDDLLQTSKPMADLTPSSGLLAETYGLDALAYLCNTDRASVLERLDESTSLSVERESVLEELLGLASHLTKLSAEDNVPVAMRLDVLGRFHEETETSIGNALRLRCGGQVSIESSDDAVECELLTLLSDAYPLLLLPIEDRHFPCPEITSALWTNPARKRLDVALLEDSVCPDCSPRNA